MLTKYSSDSWIALIVGGLALIVIVSSASLMGFNLRVIVPCFTVLATTLLYLWRRASVADEPVYLRLSKRREMLSNSLFLILFAVSILLLFKDPYARPLVYFVMVSFMCGLVALEIPVSSPTLVLPKILAIGLSLQLGILYSFPSIVGVDAPYHLGLVNEVLSTGKIISPAVQSGMYTEFPATHLGIVTNMLVLDVDYKSALTTAIALPFNLVLTLFTYLLGRKLFCEKTGLFGALIVATFPFCIWLGYINAPITFGVALLPILLYLFLFRESRYLVLGAIVLITVCLSHPLAMTMILVISVGLFLGSLMYKRKHKTPAYLFPISLVIIICFARWLYLFGRPMFADVIQAGVGLYEEVSELFKEGFSIISSAYVYSNVSSPVDYLCEILNTLGFSLAIGLAIFGLFWLVRRENSVQVVEFTYAAILFCAVAIGSAALAIMGIIPHRWLAPMAIFIAPLAAIGIRKISSQRFVTASVVTFLAFLMITNSVANMDSPIYAKDNTVRYAFTDLELAASEHSYQIARRDYTYTDASYFGSFRSFPHENEAPLPQGTGTQGIFLIRDYIFHNAFYIVGEEIKGKIGIVFLTSQEAEDLRQFGEKMTKIYDNGDVDIYFTSDVTAVIIPKEFSIVTQ